MPQSQAALGQGNVGYAVMPVFGNGKMAGDLAHDVTEAWKSANPDTVNNDAIGGNDLAV